MRRIIATSCALVVALSLSACTGGDPETSATPTVTVTASPTSSPSGSPVPSAPPSASPGATPSATPSETQAAGERCLSSSLAPSLGESSGAAGSVEQTIVLTNIGAVDCTLQGWPGISLVYNGDGTQLGAAAQTDQSAPHDTVTLAADGGMATVLVRIVEALSYSNADCGPRDADGIRIYPPGDTGALFVATTGVVGCSTQVPLLTTAAVVAG